MPSAATKPIHNLPARDFAQLIGRDRELVQIQQFLSFESALHCLSIEGMGGMGKTTLALAAAYANLSGFSTVVFASAKTQRLTTCGIVPRLKPDRHLRDVFRAIAHTFNRADLLLKGFDQQIETIQQLLAQQPTLLLIDNLETVEDWQLMLAFLCDLPATVKVLLTSRHYTPFASIRLLPLAKPDSLTLLQQQATTKQVSLNALEMQYLCDRTSGIPAAIVYAVGQVAAGYTLNGQFIHLGLTDNEYTRFYFETSMMPLRGQFAHQLLMALALFPQSAPKAALSYVAGSHDAAMATTGLALLQQLSLLSQHNDRYEMLSLTRDYVIAELSAHPAFEQQARDRWIDWYISFTQEYGGQDAKEWNDYTALEQEWENLRAVMEWCIANDRYDDARRLWQQVQSYTHARGYRGDRLTDWNTRLEWTTWLLAAAEQHREWAVVLDLLYDQGWTLTLMGNPKQLQQAAQLYTKAWTLRSHRDTEFQGTLAIHIAVLQIEQGEFNQALQWLQTANRLLDACPKETPAVTRSLTQLLYYYGEIAYKTGDYFCAQTLFEQALVQAEEVNWQRATFLIKDWLADIAIQLRHFSDAQELLQEGLDVAIKNQDACRVAFCERSLAQLEKAQGNAASAHQWATTAKQRFETLGMVTEATETMALLQML
ncbi:MAG: ATP-binding protein [Leptolyngbyaceae cyanobacterium SL_7_1]|nr:ATP-binding protein [Leptolyngbyaceae cyanobacterium SL_7_1]